MKSFYYASLSFILLLPSSALAAGNLGNALSNLRTSGGAAGTQETDPAAVAGAAINAALGLVGLIFLALMVYAGYLWMTARGESEQVDKAKKIISATIIGLIIVMSAYAITQLVTSRLGSVG